MTCAQIPSTPITLAAPPGCIDGYCPGSDASPGLRIQITFNSSPFTPLNKTVVAPHSNGANWSYSDNGGYDANKILEARISCPGGRDFLEAQYYSGGWYLFQAYSTPDPITPPFVGQVINFTSGAHTATITILGIDA